MPVSYQGTFIYPCDTSAIQLETLLPIHVGNKCLAAAEWPGRQSMLSCLLSRHCHSVVNTTGQTMVQFIQKDGVVAMVLAYSSKRDVLFNSSD